MIFDAAGEGHERHAALEQFARSYWYPVYAFIRKKGAAHEEAEDLTQGFFEQMLEKNWLTGVERRSIRFSTLLLNILNNFLISEHRHTSDQKRGGGNPVMSLDMAEAEDWFGAEPSTNKSPERVFERRFALSVLKRAMKTMKKSFQSADRGQQFEILSPFLSKEPNLGEYAAAAGILGISAKGVAAAVLRLRKAYRKFVREEVAAGLVNPAGVDEEMRHLAGALAS